MANDDSNRAGRGLKRLLVNELETLERAGVTHLPKPRKRPASKAVATPVTAEVVMPVASCAPEATKPAVPVKLIAPADRDAALAIIRQEVAGCTRCDELARTRTQTVFGVGNPNARLCFLGEAPGADEDERGEPFVGRAGQLLTKIIEACTLKREDVYILNVLKCRPPSNRTPAPDEVSNCREYLNRQLDIIRPEYLCCLGAVAAQTLLQTETTIGKLRGQLHDYRGITVLCTYHPAYLLRNPDAKRFVWDDMKILMRRMGVEL